MQTDHDARPGSVLPWWSVSLDPRLARAFLLVLLIFLGACSSRFFYNKVDWYIAWKVQGYVSLTDEQQQAFKADIQARLDEARVAEIPRLAALLNKAARDVESGYVSAETIDLRYREVMGFYDEFMLGIVPLSQRLLMGLSEEQINELTENIDKVNDEMYEEYSGRTPEEREENRNKAAVKGMERFTGRLDTAQRALIHDTLLRMEDASEEWIAYQREWQSRFRQLLLSRPPYEEYREILTLLFVYPRSLHSAEYRARVESNRAILNDMLEELIAGLTDKQRARMVEKLDGYAELLTRLAAED